MMIKLPEFDDEFFITNKWMIKKFGGDLGFVIGVGENIDDVNKKVADSVMIINFAHPITDAQREQIQQLTESLIEEIVDIETRLDLQKPLPSQIDELIESVPLTSEEWQTTPLIINVPGFPAATATLVAKLHGRMGHFPTILSLRPVADSTPPKFEVADVLNLQQIRDEARKSR